MGQSERRAATQMEGTTKYPNKTRSEVMSNYAIRIEGIEPTNCPIW